MTRVLKDNDVTLTVPIYAADDETLSDADGNVTVVVKSERGATLSTEVIATNNGTTGLYDLDLTAATHTAALDILELSVSAVVGGSAINYTSHVKVVGGRFFRLADLRSRSSLSNTTNFPNAMLANARDDVEDFIEEFTRDFFVPQYKRDRVCGNDNTFYNLETLNVRSIISAYLDEVVMTTTNWQVAPAGIVVTDGDHFTSDEYGRSRLEFLMEVGRDAPPRDLRMAAIELAEHYILDVNSTIPDRARMMQTEWGIFTLATASEDMPTGIPEIDSILCRYKRNAPDFLFG